MKNLFRSFVPYIAVMIIAIIFLFIGALFSVASAQELQPPTDLQGYFSTVEILYAFAVLPIVQFLKALPLFDRLGQYREVGIRVLSVLVGITLAVAGQLLGFLELGWTLDLLKYGALPGLGVSSLRDLGDALIRGLSSGPAAPHNTTRIDAARLRR